MFNRQLKQQLVEAQQSVAQLQATFDAIDSHVARIDFTPDGIVLAANAVFEKAMGLHKAKIKSLGQPRTDLIYQASNNNKVKTTIEVNLNFQEISDKLCVSPKTVNSYRYRIFEKLGIDGDVELTILAMKHGILDMQASV